MVGIWRGRQPKCRYLLHELDPDGTLAAAGHVGLITFKDCKAAMAEALGIPTERTGHFSRLCGSNALEDCDILLVMGTQTLRPADLARLARAYYHADPQLIDETSVRGEDGSFHYRDPRRRSQRGQCAHPGRADESVPIATGRGSFCGRVASDAVCGGDPLVFR
jgi:hypothetical protein